MTFKPNEYIIRHKGKPVKGILQHKAYKVEYSTNRWVKLLNVPKKYSTKYFYPRIETRGNVLRYHLNNWKPMTNEFTDIVPERFMKLCELAHEHKASNFLIEAITKKLIK
jgi:lipoate-protein ligase A